MRSLSFPTMTVLAAALAATPVLAQTASTLSSLPAPTAMPASKQSGFHKQRHVNRYMSTDNIADRPEPGRTEKALWHDTAGCWC